MRDRKIHWRCFHCDATFTKEQARWAREHFGATESETPVCLIRSAGEDALLRVIRDQQEELNIHRSEDTDLIRAMFSMSVDHRQQLTRVEELGYERGLRDARAELSAVAED